MGLSADPNKAVPIPSFKQERLKAAKIVNGFIEEEIDENDKVAVKKTRRREYVAKQLEEDANELREPQLR